MARKRYLDGLEDAQRAFRAAPREFQEKITDAVNRSAEEIAGRARVLVTVDQGDLKESIEVKRASASKRGIAAYVLVGNFVAGMIEFGTVKMAAQPFLFPAYQSIRKRVDGRIRRAVKAAAKEVARRGR